MRRNIANYLERFWDCILGHKTWIERAKQNGCANRIKGFAYWKWTTLSNFEHLPMDYKMYLGHLMIVEWIIWEKILVMLRQGWSLANLGISIYSLNLYIKNILRLLDIIVRETIHIFHHGISLTKGESMVVIIIIFEILPEFDDAITMFELKDFKKSGYHVGT
jgi:hypothetical protein